MKESLEDALGDELELVKRQLGPTYEMTLRSVEVMAGCRYPKNGAARVAFGKIRMKARAGLRASDEDKKEFTLAIAAPSRKKTKAAKTVGK